MTETEKLEFLETAIKSVFNKKLKSPISPEDRVLDIGLDSLDTVELQMYYEDKTQHEISTTARIYTVKDLMVLMK